MPPLDSSAWLADIDQEAPAGPSLEFDADFGALERAAQGKPDQQFGDIVVPAEDPDWQDVAAQAAALTERTRDLRVLGLLAVSRLHSVGFEAFAEILSLTRQILETRWQQIHPQLDPDDDNDPTLRANALLALADNRRVVRFLKDMPLASSPRAGRFSWRDISIATGSLEPEDGKEKPTEAVISGAFRETDQGRLASLTAALTTSIGEFVAIPAVFDANAGYGSGPDFSEILKLLREIQRFVDRFSPAPDTLAASEAVSDEPDPVAEVASAARHPAASDGRIAGPITATSLTSITTRSDALHLLDLVLRYYERYEPSSPLPLLISRARRLADKAFLEILQDLAPDGVVQARNIAGSANDPL